ncbi:MAG: N-acetylmuramoyl-L-alanine amidase family protein [Limisphaerales bacterium]
MKFVFALVFFLATFTSALAQTSITKLERVRLSGTDYIRLNDWAKAMHAEVRWLKKEKELQINHREWKLFFEVDTRRSQINGINILLSFPVLWQKGIPFISVVDLQATVQPILFLPKNATRWRVKTIGLDPGHGGKEPGFVEKNNKEKNQTLLLAEEVQKILLLGGFKVVMTRSKDEYIDLPERAGIANRRAADVFLSFHFNAAIRSAVKGAEIYCLAPAGTSSSNTGPTPSGVGSFPGNAQNEKNILLAYQMQKSLLKSLPIEDRGVKRARFEVLRDARMPAILIEGGFMTNPAEAKKIYDSAYRKKMARAIVDGILAYKQIVEQ